MKLFFTLVLIIIATLPSFAQTPDISFYGYVNFSAIFDSRQSVASREGHFFLYPKPKSLDIDGKDLNAQGNLQLAVIQTRAGVKLSGTSFFNAKASAVLEAEFMGNSDADVNGLRIRHAYINLDWQQDALLIGQTWSMFTPPEMLPGVIGSNGGAPINPFARSPQIRYSHLLGDFKIMAAIQSQRDFASPGPNGTSSEYLRNAIVPEMHLQLQYKNAWLFSGLGGSYKFIKPNLKTASNLTANNSVPGYALIGYTRFVGSDYSVKFEGLYGANLHELTMISGYAVSFTDAVTKEDSFTPLKIYSVWTDLTYGKSIEFGLFAGISKNLGSEDNITGKYYARGQDIDHIYRLAPRMQISNGKIKLCFEIEHTIAAYGNNDLNGKVTSSEEVSNTRLHTAVYYFF